MRPLKTESFFWLVTAGEVRDSMQEKDSMSHCWLLDRDALWQSSRWPPEAIGGPCKQQGKGEFSHPCCTHQGTDTSSRTSTSLQPAVAGHSPPTSRLVPVPRHLGPWPQPPTWQEQLWDTLDPQAEAPVSNHTHQWGQHKLWDIPGPTANFFRKKTSLSVGKRQL